MKNLLIGLALVACASACHSPSAKQSVSDGSAPAANKEACAGACEAGKAGCCSEKAGEEAKTCPGMKKVEG